jgi:hypothetical protein
MLLNSMSSPEKTSTSPPKSESVPRPAIRVSLPETPS